MKRKGRDSRVYIWMCSVWVYVHKQVYLYAVYLKKYMLTSLNIYYALVFPQCIIVQ